MSLREYGALREQWLEGRAFFERLYAGLQVTLHRANWNGDWKLEQFLPSTNVPRETLAPVVSQQPVEEKMLYLRSMMEGSAAVRKLPKVRFDPAEWEDKKNA